MPTVVPIKAFEEFLVGHRSSWGRPETSYGREVKGEGQNKALKEVRPRGGRPFGRMRKPGARELSRGKW